MTNRQYLEGLSDEELAKLLISLDYRTMLFTTPADSLGFTNLSEAIAYTVNWLKAQRPKQFKRLGEE